MKRKTISTVAGRILVMITLSLLSVSCAKEQQAPTKVVNTSKSFEPLVARSLVVEPLITIQSYNAVEVDTLNTTGQLVPIVVPGLDILNIYKFTKTSPTAPVVLSVTTCAPQRRLLGAASNVQQNMSNNVFALIYGFAGGNGAAFAAGNNSTVSGVSSAGFTWILKNSQMPNPVFAQYSASRKYAEIHVIFHAI